MARTIKPRSLGPVLFLTLAFVLASVLAYQAADAARSHRETARRLNEAELAPVPDPVPATQRTERETAHAQ